MAESFKFIHASELRLDLPMQGLTKLSPHLKPALTEAPYAAAAHVIDHAINERVDFVLLSGKPFDHKSAGPRAWSFLLNQFQRLAEQQIKVYWATDNIDAPNHSFTEALPSNVITFSSESIEVLTHTKQGQTVATLHGTSMHHLASKSNNFFTTEDEPFPMAITGGELEVDLSQISNIRYWAMGGRALTHITETAQSTLGCPGTPQGRSLRESGACGCLLGRVSKSGDLTLRKIETDTVRWIHQKITIPENVSDEQLKNIFSERAMILAQENPNQNVMVQWHLLTNGQLNISLRQAKRKENLLNWLRQEFSNDTKNGLWTTDLVIEPPKSLPHQWHEEDTILGDYLRAVETYQHGEPAEISLQDSLPESAADSFLSELVYVDPNERSDLLRQTAMVGIDYMGPSLTRDDSLPTDPETI